jgi:hypothetical protein
MTVAEAAKLANVKEASIRTFSTPSYRRNHRSDWKWDETNAAGLGDAHPRHRGESQPINPMRLSAADVPRPADLDDEE